MHWVERPVPVTAEASPRFLLASASAGLRSAIGPTLLDSGARVEIAASAEEAQGALQHPALPCLVLLDADLPAVNPEMNIIRLLAAVRAAEDGRRLPVVVISSEVTQEWQDRLAQGVIDDLIPPTLPPSHWRIRLDLVVRACREAGELAHLREADGVCPLTGLYNRAALLSMLFRETDRVQRMNSSLCLLLFGMDDFAHWNTRLGSAACDELLLQAVERVRRLLRSYDLFGRLGRCEFVLGLPGCSLVNAVSLAERIRVEVFAPPFSVQGAAVRLTAGFGIASSEGRSPVVVLREAEQALQNARAAAPGSIRVSHQRHCPNPWQMQQFP